MAVYSLPNTHLVLASASASRQQMLSGARLDFTAIPAAVDEDALKAAARAENMSAADAATMIAEMKARKISALEPDAFVLGSDQLLVCGDRWFSKPETKQDAAETLRVLSGQTHQLVTAAVVYQHGQRIWHQVESPEVSIRTLSDDDITDYITAMGADIYVTPGVYMIEGLGAQIISAIKGCPYSVLGLPLLHLLAFLRGHELAMKEQL